MKSFELANNIDRDIILNDLNIHFNLVFFHDCLMNTKEEIIFSPHHFGTTTITEIITKR